MEIKNIILAKYFELSDRSKYDYVLRYYTDSQDVFNLGDFTKLQFENVKDLQYKFTKGVNIKDVIDFISNEKDMDIKEIGSIKFMEFAKSYNYIKKQVDFINILEENSLAGTTTPEAEQADVARFDKFGYLIQLDKLANGDITKYPEVKSLIYIDCFTKLLLEKEREEFNQELNKIQSRKHGKV